MKVRFLADADVNKAIVTGVLRREPLLDFLAAQTAGLRGMGDPEVLALAARQRRVLVSHVGTMPAHFRAFRSCWQRKLRLFLVPQSLDIATATDEIILVWLASDASDWENRLEWLPL